MDWSSYFGLSSIPATVAIVGLFRWLKVPSEYAPLLSVACGVAWNLLLAPLVDSPLYPAAVLGVIAGLSAAGLYDVGKKTYEVLRR